MKKKNADKILEVITPYMDRLGLHYVEAVPVDFLSKDVFLELGITAPNFPTALQKHLDHSYKDNEIVKVSQKNFIDTVNQFVDSPLGCDENEEEEEVRFSLCPIG